MVLFSQVLGDMHQDYTLIINKAECESKQTRVFRHVYFSSRKLLFQRLKSIVPGYQEKINLCSSSKIQHGNLRKTRRHCKGIQSQD